MITASPWIATYDRRITDTATEGFYVAYLFSIDFKRLYLSLAFGTTQFAEYFKNIGERHEKLASAAAQFRTLVKPERTLYVDTLKLAATSKDRLHSDYQYSNIWAIQYDLNLVPPEDILVADYRYMLGLYKQLVDNPLLPDMQQLLEAQISLPAKALAPIVKKFVARPPKSRKKGLGGHGTRDLSRIEEGG